MPESKISKGLFAFLAFGAAGILAVIGVFAVKDYAVIFTSYRIPLLIFSLAVIAGIILLGNKFDWGNRIPKGLFLFLIVLLTLAPRLFWVFSVRNAPFSDFLHMQEYGAAVSRGEFTNCVDFYVITPYKYGFGFLLGGVYSVFGSDPIVGELFNTFLSCILVWLVYRIAKEIKPEAARASALFYAVWPSGIMYGNLVAAENSFLVFFLAAILVFIRYINNHTGDKQDKKGYALLILMGGLLAISQTLRPTGMVMIPVIAVVVLFFVSYRKHGLKGLMTRILCILIAVVSYYGVLKAVSIPVKNLTGIDLTRENSGYSLMVGTNYESSGMFNWPDFYFMRDHQFNYDVVHREAAKLALQRIEENPVRFLKLVVKKIDVQWGKENYGYYWSTTSANSGNPIENLIKLHPRVFYAVSQFYYLILLFLAVIGCYSVWKRKNRIPAMLFLIMGGLFLAFCFVEVQPRYHFIAVPIFIVLAAVGSQAIKNLRPARRKTALSNDKNPGAGAL